MPPLPRPDTPGVIFFYMMLLAVIASIIWAIGCFARAIEEDKRKKEEKHG